MSAGGWPHRWASRNNGRNEPGPRQKDPFKEWFYNSDWVDNSLSAIGALEDPRDQRGGSGGNSSDDTRPLTDEEKNSVADQALNDYVDDNITFDEYIKIVQMLQGDRIRVSDNLPAMAEWGVSGDEERILWEDEQYDHLWENEYILINGDVAAMLTSGNSRDIAYAFSALIHEVGHSQAFDNGTMRHNDFSGYDRQCRYWAESGNLSLAGMKSKYGYLDALTLVWVRYGGNGAAFQLLIGILNPGVRP